MTVEQDFARWLDHRDTDALARVFDATGGRLLLVATHLVDGASTGDLVQATFVAAMTRGASWDRRRPLMPWLAAVLQNEARMRWRAGRRRREVAIEAIDGAAADGRDPRDVLASREVLDRVGQAIDALPRTYRQVLKLRLVHDLQPIEIARSLEVPVGTVRARLHRGLAQLRQALPAGIASTVALLLVGDDALLAQVRRRVLERAADATPLTSATTAAGASAPTGAAALLWWLPMKAKLWTALAVGLISLFLLLRAFDTPPAAPPEDAVGTSAPVAATAAVAGGTGEVAEPERALVGAPRELDWALLVEVRDGAGAPLADADVEVWVAPQGGSFWNRSSMRFLSEHVVDGRTAADGVFRHDLADLRARTPLWRASNTLWIRARMADAEADYAGRTLPSTGGAFEPIRVELQLRRGPAVVGRVVDADGRPVERAEVRAAGASTSESDRDGRFYIGVYDPSDWVGRLSARHPTLGSAHLEVPPAGAGAHVADVGDVALSPGPSIHGRLLLGDGSPLTGWQVMLNEVDATLGDDIAAVRRWQRENDEKRKRREDRPYRTSANTDAEGRFRFAGLKAGGRYLVQTWGVNPEHVFASPDRGALELRLEQQLLTIDVVDATGVELPGVSVALDGFDPEKTHDSWTTRPGAPTRGQICGNYIPCGDEHGRRQVLSPFGFVWSIYTTEDSLRPFDRMHEAHAGVHRANVRIVVEPERSFGSLHVTAFDPAGARVPCGVALRSLERDLYHDYRRVIQPPDGLTVELPAGRWSVHAVLGKELVFLHGDGGFARGEQHHEVTIERGRTTELRLESPPRGLVSFQLRGTAATADVWRSLRFERDGEAVEVLPVDETDPRPASRLGAVVRRVITRQGLPPGRHTFVVRGDGVHDAIVHAEVEADAMVEATVTLFPR